MKKILRLKFLKKLYEVTNGSTSTFANFNEIGKNLSLNEDESYIMAKVLHDFNFAKIETQDGGITITTEGILEIEKSPLPRKVIAEKLIDTSLVDRSFWTYLHPRVRELAEERFEMGYFADCVLICLREINSKLKKYAIDNGREERDGASLMTNTFSLNDPLVQFADLGTETGRNIQLGYMRIFEGAMTGIRNPKSHENMYPNESKTIHFLFIASFMIIKLEESGVIV